MGLDGFAAKHLVALKYHMEALAAHILALVLESSFGKDDDLAEDLRILQLVEVLLEKFVDELQPASGYLWLRFRFDAHFSRVAQHDRRSYQLLLASHLQQYILRGFSHASILIANFFEQIVEKASRDQGCATFEVYICVLY